MNKTLAIFQDYLLSRPYFLAFVRTLEINHFLKAKPLSGKTLDFGCGDGFFLAALQKYYPRLFYKSEIIGLDIVNVNKAKNYKKTVVYNGQKIPFKTNSVDNIVSNCVLEHIPNLEQSLVELKRVLKPKGRFITTVLTDKWHTYCTLPNWFWDRVQVHHNLYSKDKWQKTFVKTGFKVRVVKGYLDQPQVRLVELGHFLGAPYLFSKLFFDKWTSFGFLYKFLGQSKAMGKLLQRQVNSNIAAGLYFELEAL